MDPVPTWSTMFWADDEKKVVASEASLDPAASTGFDTCLIVGQTPESQYDLLRRLETEDCDLPPRVACLALSGQRFHGQHGRPWQVCPGNLHLSVRVKLDLSAAQYSHSLVMLPAVAVLDTLSALLAAEEAESEFLGVKWVNDIMLANKKVAGVLTSTRSLAGRLESVVFGIGMNVLASPEIPVTPWTGPPTHLAQKMTSPPPALGPLTESLLTSLSTRLEELVTQGSGPLVAAYRAQSLVIGKQAQLWMELPKDPQMVPDPDIEGRIEDVLPDLSLKLVGIPDPVSPAKLTLPNSSPAIK